MKNGLLALGVCIVASSASGEVLSGSKGTVQIPLGYGIVVNEGSQIERQWIVINDEKMPASLPEAVIPVPKLNDRSYIYTVDYDLQVSAPVSAVEIRFILFDIWGQRTKTLSATEITEMPSGSYKLSHQWRLPSENEASEHFASISYISQIRLASGDIVKADQDAVLAEARKFSEVVSMGDLAPDQ